MDREEAIAKANQNYLHNKARTLVVYESHQFWPCSEEELETYWLGAKVVYDASEWMYDTEEVES